MKRKIFTVIMGVVLILSGCGAKQTDLDKLQGDWRNDSGGIIIYAPNEKNATYEWHESSQKIIITATDGWGDRVNITYKYEIVNDTELDLTPVEYSDSVKTYNINDGDTQIFEKQ